MSDNARRSFPLPAPVYQNYVFDLYGTLVDIHTNEEKPELWQTLCRLLAMRGIFWQPDALRRHYENSVCLLAQKAHGSLPKGAKAEIDISEVFRSFYPKETPPTDDEIVWLAQVFRALSLEKLQLFTGVPELLAKLHAAGKRVYLLSNAQALFTRPELQALGLTELFDGILLSSEAGRKKPDPAFFRMLMQQQHLEPGVTLMTGNDDAADCRAAAAAGLDSCYIQTEQSPALSGPLPGNCRVLQSIGALGETL